MKKSNTIKMLIVLKTENLNQSLEMIKKYREVMDEEMIKNLIQYCQREKEEILKLNERLRGETG